jgi:hypothetical protein
MNKKPAHKNSTIAEGKKVAALFYENEQALMRLTINRRKSELLNMKEILRLDAKRCDLLGRWCQLQSRLKPRRQGRAA